MCPARLVNFASQPSPQVDVQWIIDVLVKVLKFRRFERLIWSWIALTTIQLSGPENRNRAINLFKWKVENCTLTATFALVGNIFNLTAFIISTVLWLITQGIVYNLLTSIGSEPIRVQNLNIQYKYLIILRLKN